MTMSIAEIVNGCQKAKLAGGLPALKEPLAASLFCLILLAPFISNTDVFSALGQLQIYELATGPSRKIVILPRDQNTEHTWHKRLHYLNLGLITFEQTDVGYLFRDAIPSEW